MKTLRLLFLLPLLACDPNTEADSEIQVVTGALGTAPDPTATVHTFVGLMTTAEDGQRFDRWESRTPASLLPLRSPKIEIDQRRWDTIRAGKDWPRSRDERTALGMGTLVCSDSERCDRFSNCDGFDHDGFNNDGVDDTEYPVLAVSSTGLALGIRNCETNQSFMPNRCNGKYSAQKDYVSTQCSGCATADFLTYDIFLTEKFVWFTEANFGGYCGIINRDSGGSPPDGLYGDKYAVTNGDLRRAHVQFDNNITSFRFSGHLNSPGIGGQIRGALELWSTSSVDGLNANVLAAGCNVPPFPGAQSACPPYDIPSLVGHPLNNDTSAFRLNGYNNDNAN